MIKKICLLVLLSGLLLIGRIMPVYSQDMHKYVVQVTTHTDVKLMNQYRIVKLSLINKTTYDFIIDIKSTCTATTSTLVRQMLVKSNTETSADMYNVLVTSMIVCISSRTADFSNMTVHHPNDALSGWLIYRPK